MFGWEFPPHISGGLGTASLGLTSGLARKNVHIRFVVPKTFGDEDQRFVNILGAGDVRTRREWPGILSHWPGLSYMEVGSALLPYVSPEGYKTHVQQPASNKSLTGDGNKEVTLHFSGGYSGDMFEEVSNYAKVAYTIAEKYAHEVIHVHDWPTFPAGIAAKTASGKPLVVHVHATEYDRSGSAVNQEIFATEQAGMRFADRIIAVSEHTRNRIIHQYGIPAEKVVTVYNGVDFRAQEQAPGWGKGFSEKVVTFLGRITYQKGPEYFVEAAKLVTDHKKDVRFVMAGSGDLIDRMIQRTAELGISDRFHFTGFLSEQDVNKLFTLTDVFVMPSVSEPFGIVPLEAMHQHIPVIVSKQSGVAEILNHAIKVDFWDVHGLADAIHGLLRYKGLSSMFRKNGKAEVEELKWDYVAAQVKALYEALIPAPVA